MLPNSPVVRGGAGASTSRGGAPIGNQNARQHGLYSQLSPLPPDEQIAALRVYIDGLVARLPALVTPRQIGLALHRFVLATNALSRLVRAQIFPPEPARSMPSEPTVASRVGFGFPRRTALARPSRAVQTTPPRSPHIPPLVLQLTYLLYGPLHPTACGP